MPDIKASVARGVLVFLEDENWPKHGRGGLSAALVHFCSYGGVLRTKDDVATTWSEISSAHMPGWYSFTFNERELRTPGWFSFSAHTSGIFAFPGLLWLNTYDQGVIVAGQASAQAAIQADIANVDADVANLDTDVSTLSTKVGTPQGASVSADVLDIHNHVDTVETTLGTPQGASISVDILKVINGVLGRISWDFSTDPWTISFYAEDNTTLIASFTYSNEETYEERRRT